MHETTLNSSSMQIHSLGIGNDRTYFFPSFFHSTVENSGSFVLHRPDIQTNINLSGDHINLLMWEDDSTQTNLYQNGTLAVNYTGGAAFDISSREISLPNSLIFISPIPGIAFSSFRFFGLLITISLTTFFGNTP